MAMKNFSQIPLHKFTNYSGIPVEILLPKLNEMNHNSFQLEMLKLYLPLSTANKKNFEFSRTG